MGHTPVNTSTVNNGDGAMSGGLPGRKDTLSGHVVRHGHGVGHGGPSWSPIPGDMDRWANVGYMI